MAVPNCRLLFYYGGYISSEGPKKQYVGGNMKPIDIDTDMISYIDFRAVVEEELECPKLCELYHKAPNETMDAGLVSVTCDKTMLEMFAIHEKKNNKFIDIYVHNPVMEHKQPSGTQESGLTKGDHLDDLIDVDDLINSLEFHDIDKSMNPVDLGERDEEVETDKEWVGSGDESGEGSDESGGGSDESGGGSDESGDRLSGFNKSSEDDEEEVDEPMVVIQNEEGELSDKSDEVECLEGNEDSGQNKWVEFNPSKDMENPRLVEGMVFPNVNAFRACLKEFHIREGCEYKYVKNEPTRVTVKCKEAGCGFRVHASPMHIDKSFQIKTLSGDHSCTRKFTNKFATHNWIAKKYLEELSCEPDKKVKTLKNDVKRKWMLDISTRKAYRAKRAAVKVIQGDFEEQYKRIRDYCHVLLKHNPGSTALLKVERIGDIVHFQRMFISFDAQVKGFLGGCRPFIGLDACFLKGPYGGQLMHATARDGNNQMYPLCMAIVEAELKDSWAWFLDILLQIIGRPEQRPWCFMSDRQKGLIEAFKQVCPNVEHRFCLRHMYANFNKTFKGKELKDLFWAAASAYTEPEFKEKMAELKGISVDAHDWMMSEAPELWARAYYSPRSKCNRMDNNMSEGFNTWIKEAREKPVLTLVETIRRQLMSRYVQRREFSTKFKSKLCPNIVRSIETKKVNGRGLQVIYAGGTMFEVTKMEKTFVVDIGQHTCSCRKWDLSGVPCVHGCAAIIAHRSQPEDYVDDWYTAETFVRTYNQMISPIPDKSLWPHTESDPLLPPVYRVPTGRPRKVRRKGEDEPKNPYKVRKHNVTTMCRKCGLFGHNRRTCTTAVENFVQHKGKYYGIQKAKYGGVPPAGKPSSKGRGSGSGSATTNEASGSGSATGRGRGRGRGRAGARGGGRGRGRAGPMGGATTIEAAQQEPANKRMKSNIGAWLSTQQSSSTSPSKLAVGPWTRGGRIVKTISSQGSTDPNK